MEDERRKQNELKRAPLILKEQNGNIHFTCSPRHPILTFPPIPSLFEPRATLNAREGVHGVQKMLSCMLAFVPGGSSRSRQSDMHIPQLGGHADGSSPVGRPSHSPAM